MPINRITNKRTMKEDSNKQQEQLQNEPVLNATDDINNSINLVDKPFISNTNETVLSINLNDFNSRSELVNLNNTYDFFNINNANSSSSNNNVNTIHNSSNLTMPDITFITEAPKKSTNNKKRNAPVRFTRSLLWFPLIAFVLVALVAIVAGITYAYLNYEMVNSVNKTNIIQIKKPTYNTDLTNSTVEEIKKNNPLLEIIKQVPNKYECGQPAIQPNLRQVRIIRGHDAVPHSWPWTVSLGYYGPKSIVPHACGGSLINKRTIVTATHCVVKESIYRLVGSPVPNSSLYGTVEAMMRIFVGINKRSTDISSNNTYYAVKVLSFPGFNENTFQNDLTLITLDRDVELSDDVSFICVSNKSKTSPGTPVYAVGWGFTESNFFKASDSLMQVKINIKSFENCGLSYIPIFQFCAGNPDQGKDTCNGDSGGPIMEYIDNRWILAGIVSNGDSGCTGRGIYTNIAFYYNWIMQNS